MLAPLYSLSTACQRLCFCILLSTGVLSPLAVTAELSQAPLLQPLNTRDAKSNLKRDESLVLFRTDGFFDAAANTWRIPVHGWVYETEHSWFRNNAFARMLEYKYDLTRDADSSIIFGDRTGLIIADNERNKKIVLRLGDALYALPPSAENGHFKAEIALPESTARDLLAGNLLFYQAVLPEGDTREFSGTSQLLTDEGIAVISDIDDTIKETGVTETKTLLASTFFQPFVAVPGMAPYYRRLAGGGASLLFISSSPWQLYSELVTFSQAAGFPFATYYLKSIRFKDTSIFNLFKSGMETKPVQIEALMQRYPNRRFILIGDSGEHDPEAYVLMHERYPKRIPRILIRNVTDASPSDLRFAPLLARLPPNTLYLFRSPTELAQLQLSALP